MALKSHLRGAATGERRVDGVARVSCQWHTVDGIASSSDAETAPGQLHHDIDVEQRA
jgi:hypothetical protein